MISLLHDLRYGLRMLRKSSGISIVATLTLALGIGANTTIFSVMNGVFFRPLPFRAADRLVVLSERNIRDQNWMRNPAMATVFDWQKHTQSFAEMELAVNNQETANLTLENETQRLKVQFVSAGLPKMLGINPVIGQSFDAPDVRARGTSTGGVYDYVLISYSWWRSHWGGDPSVLGKRINLFSTSLTIIGVMPPNAWVYPWLRNIDVWLAVDPASDPKEFLPELRWLGVLAVLRPEQSLQQARAEMNALGRELAQAHPETNRDWTADALPPQEAWFGRTKKSFYLLLGAVGFVLLIACANVANLLLARAGVRATEMAIRASIGGTRARILRQLLTESVLLALIGGALGLALSYWGVRLFVALLGELGSLVERVVVDWRVLTFTLGLATFTGILFGLVPALRISTFDLNRTLKEGGDRAGGGTRNLGGSLLVAVEVGLTMILLAGAGLMVNSFVRLQTVDLGFDPTHVLTATVELDGSRYKQFVEGDMQRPTPAVDDFFGQTVQRLRTAPGVASAGLEGPAGLSLIRVAGRPENRHQRPTATIEEIDEDYFRTMRIPLLSGRSLTARDDERSQWVTLINVAMVNRYFMEENPIGQQVYLTLTDPSGRNLAEPNPRVIVGIVADAKEFGPSRQPEPTMFLPYRQHVRDYLGGNAFTHFAKRFFIRTTGNPLAMTKAVRSVVGEVDRSQVITDMQSMEQLMEERLSPWRSLMEILGMLTAIAVILAAMGIYGLMSYTVNRRRHEIAVRMAMGAGPGDVLRMILKHSFKLTVLGIALGFVGALILTRFIGKMLYGVSPTDLPTFSIVSALLACIAVAASYLPARRAMDVDPIKTLRSE